MDNCFVPVYPLFLEMQDACFVSIHRLRSMARTKMRKETWKLGRLESFESLWRALTRLLATKKSTRHIYVLTQRDFLIQSLLKLPLLYTFVEQHAFVERMFLEKTARKMGQIHLPSAKVEWRKTAQRAIDKDQQWRAEFADKFVGLHIRCFSHWGLLAYGAC